MPSLEAVGLAVVGMERAVVELREHARACPRCAHADRWALHANAYCPIGRAWLFRWCHARRGLLR